MFKAVVFAALLAVAFAADKCWTPVVPCPAHISVYTSGTVTMEMWQMAGKGQTISKTYMEALNSTAVTRTDITNDKGEFLSFTRIGGITEDYMCTETWTPKPSTSASAASAGSEECYTYDKKEDCDCPVPDKQKNCHKYCAGSTCVIADGEDRLVDAGIGSVFVYADSVKLDEFTVDYCADTTDAAKKVKDAPSEYCAASIAQVALLVLLAAVFAALL